MKAATELLSSGMETLTQFAGFTLQDISLELLEGVAKVRYALLIVAQLIQLQVNEVGGAPSFSSHTHNLYRSIASRLLDEARYVLQSTSYIVVKYYWWCPATK